MVVGGHTRNIGKTSVVAGIIRAFPEMRWTAFKITQFGHGMCSANGEPCDCETAEHTVAVSEERDGASGTDSARYLEAGAVRSFWVRTRVGQLAEAMPRIRKEIAMTENAVIRVEQHSAVFEAGCLSERAGARDGGLQGLGAAVFRQGGCGVDDARSDGWGVPEWKGVSRKLLEGTPVLTMEPPEYVTKEVVDFLAERLAVKVRNRDLRLASCRHR